MSKLATTEVYGPFGEKTNRACVEVEVGFIGVVCSGKGSGLRRFASCREHAARMVTPLPLPTWNRNPGTVA